MMLHKFKPKYFLRKLIFFSSLLLLLLLTSKTQGQDSHYLNMIYLDAITGEWEGCKITVLQMPTHLKKITKLTILIVAPSNTEITYSLSKSLSTNSDQEEKWSKVFFDNDTVYHRSYFLKAKNEYYDIKFFMGEKKMIITPQIYAWSRKDVNRWVEELKSGRASRIYPALSL